MSLYVPFGPGRVNPAAGSTKPIGLPAWKGVSVDVEHILERHTKAGRFWSPSRTNFPEMMSEQAIIGAIKEAYKSGAKMGTNGERIYLEGTGGGIRIGIWYNAATRTIETAFPTIP
jgi:hypothetical protein